MKSRALGALSLPIELSHSRKNRKTCADGITRYNYPSCLDPLRQNDTVKQRRRSEALVEASTRTI